MGDDDDDNSILFLHGLLGNGRNLKTFAKQVCQVHSGGEATTTTTSATRGYLMDLRGHGKSRLDDTLTTSIRSPSPNHSFDACVQDIAHTVSKSYPTHPHTIVGHSWGGRMTLQYAATVPKNEEENDLQRIWLLDTVPGQAHASVEQVVEAVAQLQIVMGDSDGKEVFDRQQLIHELTNTYGLEMGIAQWLASSYNNKTGDFGFDLEVVQSLLPQFATQDFEGMLQQVLEKNIRVDLVRGGKNTGWTIETVSQLESLAKDYPQHFGLHVLPKAGHWVHVDDLPGLVKLFATY
jgi:pimeloyl-ACP methyl ester carboxylesterase